MAMWAAVVPVKPAEEAKSRLLPADDPHRAEFAMAFLEDVLAALSDAPLRARIVVTSDERAGRIASAHGAQVVPDPEDVGDPLNAAILAGARAAGGDVLALTADLPCLRASTVLAVLEAAGATPGSSFVGDAAGTGTTMLAMRDGATPAFGPRSRARHASLGYAPLRIPGEDGVRARRDVDTAVDLWDARRIGVGSATGRVLDWSQAP